MSSEPIDHQVIGRSRIATQYTESDKFIAFIDALLSPCNDLESLLQLIALQTDIDVAEGVNLDVLGDIVGISRIVPGAVEKLFFGFDDQLDTDAAPFGETGDLSKGARFYEEGEAVADSTVLADPEYRLVIRAKIIKNHTDGTLESIMAGLAIIYDAHVIANDVAPMEIGIAIGRWLSFSEKAIVKAIDILPRPAGVLIAQRVNYDINNYFGFEDQDGAFPYIEESSGETNGIFAEEF